MPDINLQYLPPTDGLTHPLAPRYASRAHFARSPGFFPGFVSNYFFRDSIHLPQNLEGCRNLQLLDFFSYPPNRLPVPGDLPVPCALLGNPQTSNFSFIQFFICGRFFNDCSPASKTGHMPPQSIFHVYSSTFMR